MMYILNEDGWRNKSAFVAEKKVIDHVACQWAFSKHHAKP